MFSRGKCLISPSVKLEVLIVMYKMSLIPLVHLLASFLHVLRQSRWSTAEHTDFTHLQRKLVKLVDSNNYVLDAVSDKYKIAVQD